DVERRNRHLARAEEARLIEDQWRERCAIAVKEGVTLPERPLEASFDESFVPRQLVIADATLEAMADVVAGNPRGVILWRDELEAWAAAGVTINRRSRSQPLHLHKFPVSVVGSIQPDRLADALQGGDDGMAARFLYSWPDPPPYRPLGQRCLAHDDAALARLQAIAGFTGSAETPRTVGFDDAASRRCR